MKKLIILFAMCSFILAQTTLNYKEKYHDPVHAKIMEIRNLKQDAENKITEEIRDAVKDEQEYTLFASVEGIEVPTSIDVFQAFFHFPPKHQGLTSSCWAHTGISFIETEVQRLQGKEIKLSVMQIVYCDYLEKAKYYIETRGEKDLRRGSEVAGVFRIAEEYGLIPEANYAGNPTAEGFDTGLLHDELRAYLDHVYENNFWDEEIAMTAIRAILDKHLGKIPETFAYRGKDYTPESFYKKVLKFEPKKYTAIQSTLAFPFHEYTEFPFPDNWWHGKEYYNLPVEEFYQAIVKAIKNGYSVPIGGDTSEPGFNRYAGIAFIPTADIPLEYIDQDAREYRINNETTGDDHAIHIVGYVQINGVDWFLIKDSSRTAYQSSHPGYYYFRGDYIKLKMLNAVVPTDFIK
ncbi:MAG: peptidase C1 [Candidatus Marinimicrobia bacterium]|nr:peptidase C1 [Candidatus Neomarinimicrobiota bacterium]